MNELKEQIELEGLLTIQRHKETVEIDLDRLMQLIETYTAKKCEKQLDTIVRYLRKEIAIGESYERGGVYLRIGIADTENGFDGSVDYDDGFWVNVYDQLQSQLTNNKEVR
jgi:hypothetical protein